MSLSIKTPWTLRAVACCLLFSPNGFGQAQTDLTTPTASIWMTGASPQTMNDRIADGFRIVDLEVDSTSPITFTASFVMNTGPYAKGWWWYYDITNFDVANLLSTNNARLIDLEPYSTPSGIRFAALMIPNTGNDFAVNHGWQSGMNGTQFGNWITNNTDKRILDMQPYLSGGAEHFAFTWVQNTGTQQSPWWILYGASMSTINTFLAQNGARLIDLERMPSGSGYAAIMLPGDGKSTYHFLNLTANQVNQYTRQYSSRIIDVERRFVFLLGNRYTVICRQNDNDLDIATNNAMRVHLPLGASSGFSMVRLDGNFSTVAGVKEIDIFEPASLMKTAHLFTAMLQVASGLDSLSSQVTVNSGLSGSCPTGTAPITKSYQSALWAMMNLSSNTDTEAIRARLGTGLIEATMDFIGAGAVGLNHTIGCLCGLQRNEATLMDFANMHRAAANGGLGAFGDNFFSTMINNSVFGMGAYSTQTILDTELINSALTNVERLTFSSNVSFAHKGGSYGCSATPEQHRSQGVYMRVPFRNGCETEFREYFIGAWVNDATTSASAENGVGAGMVSLYTHILRDAIGTWEGASCSPFVNYCPAEPNSTGFRSSASGSGTPYLVLNDFVMHATGLPQNVFCFLLVGTESDLVQNPAGSIGNLCIGGEIGRYSASLQHSGSQGSAVWGIDLDRIPKPTPPTTAVQAGETLYFQWWHRDTVNGAPASNFTDGLSATFI